MKCPAYDCSGGDDSRVEEVLNTAILHLPKALVPKDDRATLWHCTYCGFIWSTEFVIDGPLQYRRRTPIGFYDNFTKPDEFFAVPHNYRLKPDGPAKRKRR